MLWPLLNPTQFSPLPAPHSKISQRRNPLLSGRKDRNQTSCHCVGCLAFRLHVSSQTGWALDELYQDPESHPIERESRINESQLQNSKILMSYIFKTKMFDRVQHLNLITLLLLPHPLQLWGDMILFIFIFIYSSFIFS